MGLPELGQLLIGMAGNGVCPVIAWLHAWICFELLGWMPVKMVFG